MPLFDLADAKRAFSIEQQAAAAAIAVQTGPTQKRTMTPQNTPSAIGGNGRQGFAAARINRLTGDMAQSTRSADAELFGDNRLLRGRGRRLFTDNPHARKFGHMVGQNVIGPAGILMQSKVRNQYGKQTDQTRMWDQRIEAAWQEWCEVGNCTADGKFSFHELQFMAILNCAREGENLVKKVYGRQFNAVGFALQPLDNDQLDDTMMQALADGGEIRMGVEVDKFRRPQAYWLWSGHPYDALGGNRERVRVPADQIIHTYRTERPGQTRGYTWMSAAILALHGYEKYDEATRYAARWAAAKVAVVERDVAEGYGGDEEGEDGAGTNPDGTQYMSGETGEMVDLGPGRHLNFIDPKFPTNTYDAFTRATLRNIASGLLVSYPSLANDLAGVNFSSIRAGLLDERDCWRILQRWFIDHFCKPIRAAWVEMAKLTVLADLPLTPEQWRQAGWKPRGWEWVDPLKDAQAAVLRLQNLFSTYTDELALFGRDFEEVAEERAREQDYIEKLKLKIGTDIRGMADAPDDAGGAQAAAAKGGSGS